MLELQDLIDFSITTWYPDFKDVALKTEIISLPESLVVALQDGEADVCVENINDNEFTSNVTSVIKNLGEAFVKTNWNAPMDAKFLSLGHTLKVSNLSDLLLYLSASSITLANFDNKSYKKYCIALRKWINIHPASEFRCIVINGILRGITPRDWPTYYQHLKEEGPQIIAKLETFYQEHIKDKFPRKNYTFDVILPFRDPPQLMDFGPLNNKTTLYAFAWSEIQDLIKKNDTQPVPPVFRYLESDIGIMTRTEAMVKYARSFNGT